MVYLLWMTLNPLPPRYGYSIVKQRFHSCLSTDTKKLRTVLSRITTCLFPYYIVWDDTMYIKLFYTVYMYKMIRSLYVCMSTHSMFTSTKTPEHQPKVKLCVYLV